jgi:UDP-glucuronate 4-epimerase
MVNNTKNVLITGVAGFIGYHLAKSLILRGYIVLGIDNINDYYSQSLKLDRLRDLGIEVDIETQQSNTIISRINPNNCAFIRLDVCDFEGMFAIFEKYDFDVVFHLAAQAGVRYSLENPRTYVQNNVTGFFNVIECVKEFKVKKFIYASSSSVYGLNEKVPFSTDQNVDRPVSLYAATKKSNELFAHTYSSLYQINTIGLRFFTVYGPWGRPDMAPFLFANSIIKNKQINVFNHGELSRDFTFIDDIINGIILVMETDFVEDDNYYHLFNIGSGAPKSLEEFIGHLEKHLGLKAFKNYVEMQPGDVLKTWADTKELNLLGFKPNTSLDDGVRKFVEWYLDYYKS